MCLRLSECLNPVFYNVGSPKMRKHTKTFLRKLLKLPTPPASDSISSGIQSPPPTARTLTPNTGLENEMLDLPTAASSSILRGIQSPSPTARKPTPNTEIDNATLDLPTEETSSISSEIQSSQTACTSTPNTGLDNDTAVYYTVSSTSLVNHENKP